MHAFHVDAFAYAKLKALLGQALPGIKSSHRVETMARGFGYASNAALLSAIRRPGIATILTMHPARFEAYLSSKGWTVRGSVFVGCCFGLRPDPLDSLGVPRWGRALIDGQWLGLVLWDGRLARAELAIPKGAHGPTWLASVNLTGVPLAPFRGKGNALSERFMADARADLGYPVRSVQPRGEFKDLGPYLGGEPFPREADCPPAYEIFGARSIPVTQSPEESLLQRRREIAAGFYAGLTSY